MAQLYPSIEPYERGLMAVGHGHQVYWEECGNPNGKPALVIHGGLGSGATPGWRRYLSYRRFLVMVNRAQRVAKSPSAPVEEKKNSFGPLGGRIGSCRSPAETQPLRLADVRRDGFADTLR